MWKLIKVLSKKDFQRGDYSTLQNKNKMLVSGNKKSQGRKSFECVVVMMNVAGFNGIMRTSVPGKLASLCIHGCLSWE